jgi:hypothetical protein
MEAIRAAIKEVLETDHPQNIRQVYYALVVKGVIEKTEQEYQHTVIRLCGEMRWQDDIDWEWIVDESRSSTAARWTSARRARAERRII